MIGSNLRAVLEQYGESVVNSYREEMIRQNKVASGNLINSLKYDIIEEDNQINVMLYMADYGDIVEEGRRPTQNGGSGELQRKIEDWIVQKHIIPRPNRNGTLPTIKQLSFLISRKIHKEGYKSTPMLGGVIDSVYLSFKDRINEAIEKDISEYIQVNIDRTIGNLFKIG